MTTLTTRLATAAAAVLLALASQASAKDICAGTAYMNNDQAQAECPAVCASVEFNGQWTNQASNVAAAGCSGVSVCGTNHGDVCADQAYGGNDQAQQMCPSVVATYQAFNGNWTNQAENVAAAGCSAGQSVCGCGS